MTNFDQLFKEKAESAHYPFKETYWKRFALKAGIKSSISGLRIALFSVAGAGLIGISLYFGIKSNSNQGTPDSLNVKEVSSPCDSSLPKSLEVIDSPVLYINGQNKAAEMVKHYSDSQRTTVKENVRKENEKIFKKKEVEDRSKWRILTIDPDTIKSNY